MRTSWTYEDIGRWESGGPHVARHRLHEDPVFDTDGLAALLDRIPRDIVHPYTMGTDVTRTDEWQRGRTTDVPGAELLETVARGRLWLNVVGVGDADPTLGRLTRGLYEEISELVPGFAPTSVKTTLLISSPTAQVYYHADNQPNALWHLRGSKRVHVYPRGSRFIEARQLEAIVAGRSDEQLPYDPAFEEHAWSAVLEPGQVAWWPQNSPHRVANLEGLNVSLSTEHRTPASTRRERIDAGNHLVRQRLGLARVAEHDSPVLDHGKAIAARVDGRIARGRQLPGPRPTFVVDPSQPTGVRELA
ncbi:hypothetical protein BCF74_10177 [Knoellia remsis]|uniref:JmjC domain-containing protein n=1 Tax=Knoellia remsis TaxID=407159 RepID=A0A2T0V0G8_9MICO|nr:hypothetical protein [Knoellia remsis]PRY63679.1 hypothetical protein BCF74_10177 [Knoellia remsis]